ncbi:MAG: polysaccharide biosynthesis C-terminal domain-containing protein [Clostridium sp.]
MPMHYSYLMIIFLGASVHPAVQLPLQHPAGSRRQPDSFLFLAFSAVLNIFLDLFFILVADWGCAGAAFATIAAQAISGILCLIVIIRRMEVLWLSKENRVIRGDSITELLQMGLPTGLQFSITAIGSMVMQSANNGLGGDYVSAFTAGAKLKQFTMCPFDAIATSVSFSAARTAEPEKLTESIRGCARALPWESATGSLPA